MPGVVILDEAVSSVDPATRAGSSAAGVCHRSKRAGMRRASSAGCWKSGESECATGFPMTPRTRVERVSLNLGRLADLLLEAGALDGGTARAALARWAGRRQGESVVGQARALRAALRRMAHHDHPNVSL